MFVLGAVKAHEAERRDVARAPLGHVPDRRRVPCSKAQAQGVPEGREAQAAYLLGKCLVNGGQPQAGVAALEEALRLHAEPATEIHALLVRALIDSPDPDLEAALTHNEHVIRDAALSGERRDEAWLLRAETLLRLERPADARRRRSPRWAATARSAGQRMMLLGRLQLDEAQRLPAESAERPAKIQRGARTVRRSPTDGTRRTAR